MARQPHHRTTFHDLDCYLGSRESRPGMEHASYNTRIVRLTLNSIAVRLYDTNVLVYHRDGRIIANTGGWNTATTRHRLAAYSPVLPVPQFNNGDDISIDYKALIAAHNEGRT